MQQFTKLLTCVQTTLPFEDTGSTNDEIWPIDEIFPENEIDALLKLESFNKHLYRPNTYLHKWWARRSGILFRYILKGFVKNKKRRDFYSSSGLEGMVVLDPMMGGGTILHEAIRMGANVIGIDIDPIPVVQARATLSLRPLHEKQGVFHKVWSILRDHLASWYRTRCPICGNVAEIQFILYARRMKCKCREMLFVDDLVLLENSSSQNSVQICPICLDVYQNDHLCFYQNKNTIKVLKKCTRYCQDCGHKFIDITSEPYWKRYRPIALRGICSSGHEFFKSLETYDWELLFKAKEEADKLKWELNYEWSIPDGPKSKDLRKRGITSYLDLFTPRQKLYLAALKEVLEVIPSEDKLWLALLGSTSLEFNSLLAGYKGRSVRRPGAVRHVFAHHAYSIPYTALENNPVFIYPRSGTLLRLFKDRVERATRWAFSPVERRLHKSRIQQVVIEGELDGGIEVNRWEDLLEGKRRFLVLQADASQINLPEGIVDFVVTDPPYYDNVQYSDLSNFFRVWLRFLLPHEADWYYDPLRAAVSQNGSQDAQKYVFILSNIWKNVSRALKRPYGRLVFTFHHWRPEAWAALTVSLREAGFILVNRYVAFSENPTSVHVQGLKALKHDAILVLAPLDAKAPFRIWPTVSSIISRNSADFVRACSEALGWMLQARDEIPSAKIWYLWKKILGVA